MKMLVDGGGAAPKAAAAPAKPADKPASNPASTSTASAQAKDGADNTKKTPPAAKKPADTKKPADSKKPVDNKKPADSKKPVDNKKPADSKKPTDAKAADAPAKPPLTEAQEIQQLKIQSAKAKVKRDAAVTTSKTAADIDIKVTPEQKAKISADQKMHDDQVAKVAKPKPATVPHGLPPEDKKLITDSNKKAQTDYEKSRKSLNETYYKTHEYRVENDTVYKAGYDSTTGQLTLERNAQPAAPLDKEGAGPAGNADQKIEEDAAGKRKQTRETTWPSDPKKPESGPTSRTEIAESDANGKSTGSTATVKSQTTKAGIKQDWEFTETKDGAGTSTGAKETTTQTGDVSGVPTVAKLETNYGSDGKAQSATSTNTTTQGKVKTEQSSSEAYDAAGKVQSTSAITDTNGGPQGSTHRQVDTQYNTGNGLPTSQYIGSSTGDGDKRNSTYSNVAFDGKGNPGSTYITRTGPATENGDGKGGDDPAPKSELVAWNTDGTISKRVTAAGTESQQTLSGATADSLPDGVKIKDPNEKLPEGHAASIEYTRDDGKFKGKAQDLLITPPLTPEGGESALKIPQSVTAKSDAAQLDAKAPKVGTPEYTKLQQDQTTYQQNLVGAKSPEAKSKVQQQYFNDHDYWVDTGKVGAESPVVYAATYQPAQVGGIDPVDNTQFAATQSNVLLTRSGIASTSAEGFPTSTDVAIRMFATGERDDHATSTATTQFGGKTTTVSDEHRGATGTLESRQTAITANTRRVSEGKEDLNTKQVKKEAFDATTGNQTKGYTATATWDDQSSTLSERTDEFNAAGKLSDTKLHEEQRTRDFDKQTVDAFTGEMDALVKDLDDSGKIDINKEYTKIKVPGVGQAQSVTDTDIDYTPEGVANHMVTTQSQTSVVATRDQEYDKDGKLTKDEPDPNGVQMTSTTAKTEWGAAGSSSPIFDDKGQPIVDGIMTNHVVSRTFDPDDGWTDSGGAEDRKKHQFRQVTEIDISGTVKPDGTTTDMKYSPLKQSNFNEGFDNDWIYEQKLIKTDDKGVPQYDDDGKPKTLGKDAEYVDPATGKTVKLDHDPNHHSEDLDFADKFQSWMDDHAMLTTIVGGLVAIGGIVAAPFSGGASLALTAVGVGLATAEATNVYLKHSQGQAEGWQVGVAFAGVALAAIPGAKQLTSGAKALTVAEDATRGAAALANVADDAGRVATTAVGAGDDVAKLTEKAIAANTSAGANLGKSTAGLLAGSPRLTGALAAADGFIPNISGKVLIGAGTGLGLTQVPGVINNLTDGDITGMDIFSAVMTAGNLASGPIGAKVAAGKTATTVRTNAGAEFAAGRVPAGAPKVIGGGPVGVTVPKVSGAAEVAPISEVGGASGDGVAGDGAIATGAPRVVRPTETSTSTKIPLAGDSTVAPARYAGDRGTLPTPETQASVEAFGAELPGIFGRKQAAAAPAANPAARVKVEAPIAADRIPTTGARVSDAVLARQPELIRGSEVVSGSGRRGVVLNVDEQGIALVATETPGGGVQRERVSLNDLASTNPKIRDIGALIADRQTLNPAFDGKGALKSAIEQDPSILSGRPLRVRRSPESIEAGRAAQNIDDGWYVTGRNTLPDGSPIYVISKAYRFEDLPPAPQADAAKKGFRPGDTVLQERHGISTDEILNFNRGRIEGDHGQLPNLHVFEGDGKAYVGTNRKLTVADQTVAAQADAAVTNTQAALDYLYSRFGIRPQGDIQIHLNGSDYEGNAAMDSNNNVLHIGKHGESGAAFDPSVIMHELGHLVFERATAGGYAWNSKGSIHEGIADFFAYEYTRDPVVGRVFSDNRQPIRDLQTGVGLITDRQQWDSQFGSNGRADALAGVEPHSGSGVVSTPLYRLATELKNAGLVGDLVVGALARPELQSDVNFESFSNALRAEGAQRWGVGTPEYQALNRRLIEAGLVPTVTPGQRVSRITSRGTIEENLIVLPKDQRYPGQVLLQRTLANGQLQYVAQAPDSILTTGTRAFENQVALRTGHAHAAPEQATEVAAAVSAKRASTDPLPDASRPYVVHDGNGAVDTAGHLIQGAKKRIVGDLFVMHGKLNEQLQARLGPNGVLRQPGIEAHLLVDPERAQQGMFDSLEKAGAQVTRYGKFGKKAHDKVHSKILVADGERALLTTGAFMDGSAGKREMSFYYEGPVARDLETWSLAAQSGDKTSMKQAGKALQQHDIYVNDPLSSGKRALTKRLVDMVSRAESDIAIATKSNDEESSVWQAIEKRNEQLAAEGKPPLTVRLLDQNHGGKLADVHGSMMIVDGQEAYTGTAFFEKKAMDGKASGKGRQSREIGVVTRDPQTVAQINYAFDQWTQIAWQRYQAQMAPPQPK